MEKLYTGFSSKNFKNKKTFKLSDMELVQRDLLNHIFTRRGERAKMATFGTRIPDLGFEQLDDNALRIVQEDLESVFNYDPRVTLVSLTVIPIHDEHSILAVAELHYLELDIVAKMDVTIDLRA